MFTQRRFIFRPSDYRKPQDKRQNRIHQRKHLQHFFCNPSLTDTNRSSVASILKKDPQKNMTCSIYRKHQQLWRFDWISDVCKGMRLFLLRLHGKHYIKELERSCCCCCFAILSFPVQSHRMWSMLRKRTVLPLGKKERKRKVKYEKWTSGRQARVKSKWCKCNSSDGQ